jgi:hypothetical protein
MFPQTTGAGFTGCGPRVNCEAWDLGAGMGADSDCMYRTGTVGEGVACDNEVNPCQAGMTCIDLESPADAGTLSPKCHRWCRIGVLGDCDEAAGQACTAIKGQNITLSGTAFGVCNI